MPRSTLSLSLSLSLSPSLSLLLRYTCDVYAYRRALFGLHGTARHKQTYTCAPQGRRDRSTRISLPRPSPTRHRQRATWTRCVFSSVGEVSCVFVCACVRCLLNDTRSVVAASEAMAVHPDSRLVLRPRMLARGAHPLTRLTGLLRCRRV